MRYEVSNLNTADFQPPISDIMNINHHNYEEFFILYMDNELSSDDRRMVEAFVQQYPDLKEELDILLQYKLVPDTAIVFNGKEELLKVNGETPISLANYEEWLVLYIDNELTPFQSNAVEQFVAANPSIQEEFSLLKRSRLLPESIVFANKEVLYRKEEKVRPMPLRWWRVAAAVLVFIIGTTTVLVLNRKTATDKTDGVAKTIGTEQKNVDNKNSTTTQPNNDEAVAGNEKNSPVIDDNTNQIIPTVTNLPNTTAVAFKQNDREVKDQQLPKNVVQNPLPNESVIANNDEKPTNKLPVPLNNPNFNRKEESSNVTALAPKEEMNTITKETVTNPTTSPSDVQYASNTDLNQPNEKKSKLRGFFRKVTRTFEKRTNIDPTEDDRLLVGGLAIKLK